MNNPLTNDVFWSVVILRSRSNSMKRWFLAAVFCLVLTSVSLAQMTPTAAQAAAEKHAREIAGFITTGDRQAYKKFVEANFSEGMLKRPMSRHLDFVSAMHDQNQGFEIGKVQAYEPNGVLLQVKSKLTGGWDAMVVYVDANAPHKIDGIGLRPAVDAPKDTATLTEKQVAADLESFVKKLSASDVFSGTALLARNGNVLYKGAFGQANKDFGVANTIDTKFNLGSMNKMFTGVAIAQLVEKGKLSFDDPLSKFIPDFPTAEVAQKIKIKHLLTHTAGLGGYFSKRYDELSRAKVRTVDDMMNLAKQDEKALLFEPGSKWQYSNTGMLVLGKVVEIVSGQSYFDYVRDNIFKPAGMTNTDSYELDRVNKNLAVGYDKQYGDNGITWANNVFAHVMRGGPQGGGYSTAEDLLKFDHALRSGKLVGMAMVTTLTTPKPDLNSPDYGYGFYASADSEVTGHSGGFMGINSDLKMYTKTGWTVIVMSNYSRGAQPVSSKIETLIGSVK